MGSDLYMDRGDRLGSEVVKLRTELQQVRAENARLKQRVGMYSKGDVDCGVEKLQLIIEKKDEEISRMNTALGRVIGAISFGFDYINRQIDAGMRADAGVPPAEDGK